MAQPVLVRAYTTRKSTFERASRSSRNAQALPPISSFAFADILRSIDSPSFQTAIDGIAEICAKNRMSLADEYGSHLPPLGEITASTPATARPHLLRPGMRRALTSVPEASSGSSEGSRKSKRKSSIFGFRRQQAQEIKPMRRMRIGSMGRTVAVGSTTAFAAEIRLPEDIPTSNIFMDDARLQSVRRVPSEAQISLQRLLVGTVSQSG